jgi:hypothetical protein
MDTYADVLWRLNNEYRKRLSQAQTYLELLGHLIAVNNDETTADILDRLYYAQDQVRDLIEEHRDWRHAFYYESPETKRMVQDERAVHQALSRFSRMRSRHEQRLFDLYNLLFQTPRPDPHVTRVPTGDLWSMTEFALNDLLIFGDYITRLGAMN